MIGRAGVAQRYGIDTSVLVRLVTREPERDYIRCVNRLGILIEEQGNEVLASNQVIGEAFATITHHYGATEEHARSSLLDVLTSGLVAPVNGRVVLDILESSEGPGLFDRLITDDYARAGLETLTLDRRMASLPRASLV